MNSNQPKNLIRINDPSPNGKARVIGIWPGPDAGLLAQVSRETVRETEKFLRSAHDVRGNRNFGPVETGSRLREAAAPTLKVLNENATKLSAEKEKVRLLVATVSPTKPYTELGHWQPAFDLRLIDSFHAMPVGQRGMVSHQLRLEPVMHLDLAEALLRVPRGIAGIDESLRAEIRLGLLKIFKHDEFGLLDTQVEQLAVTERALREAIEAVVEVTGTASDLIEHAPAAFKFSRSPEDAVPVSWTPPEVPASPQWSEPEALPDLVSKI